jgi:hypothetical protein
MAGDSDQRDFSSRDEETHVDPADGMTVYGGISRCVHRWEEMPEDENGVPKDVCFHCGGVKY